MALDRKIALNIAANTKKAEADIKRLQQSLTKLGNTKLGAVQVSNITKGMTNLERQTRRTTSSMERLGNRINTAFNIAIVIGFTTALAKAGDQILNISNQLKSVGVATKEIGKETAFLLRTANATRISVSSLALVYARVTRSVSDLNYTTQETRIATTAIAQSFQLAGATAQEATNSTIQLAQGLASGALRGDELRSVLEGNAVLSRAIANELGVSVGQLRDLGAEGKITAEVVMSALLNQAEAFNEQFEQLEATFEGAFQVLKNGLSAAVGEATNILGDALGIKDAFQEVGKSLTEAFLDGRIRVAVGEFVRDAREAAAQIKGFFIGIFDGFGLEVPDLTDILAALATLLGVRALRGAKAGVTAFTPVKNDIDAINKQLAGLRAGLARGLKVGPVTGLGPVNTQLDTTRNNFGALRDAVSKPIALGTLSGFNDLDTKLNSSSTSALALRNGLKAPLQVGGIQGLDVFYQGIGQAKASVDNLRTTVQKPLTAGKLDATPITNSLATVGSQVAAMRANLARGFKVGPTSSIEGDAAAGGAGFLLAPARIDAAKKRVADFTKTLGGVTTQVQGFTDRVSGFFTKVAGVLEGTLDRSSGSLNVLTDAFDENRKGIEQATRAYEAARKEVTRLGFQYDALADKDFGTSKERNLAAQLDAESAKMNAAQADIERYTAALRATEAARGVFVSGMRSQTSAVSELGRVLGDLTKSISSKLPSSISLVERLSTGIKSIGANLTTAGNNFSVFAGQVNEASKKVGAFTNNVSRMQTNLSGQVGGTIGTGIVLSELFTVDAEDSAKFENEIVETIRSGISNALQKLNLSEQAADLTAKFTTIIGGAIGAFAVFSAIAGAVQTALVGAFTLAISGIGVLLASPIALLAGVVIGVILGALAIEKWDLDETIGGWASGLSQKTLEYFGVNSDLAAKLSGIFDGLIRIALLPLKSVGKIIKAAFSEEYSIADALGDIRGEVGEAAQLVVEAIKAPFVEFFDWIAGKFQQVSDFVSSIGNGRAERLEQRDRATEGLQFFKNGQDIGPGQPFATGGYVSGPGTATSDSIPAMLSDGEFVIKADAVKKFGAGFMAKINAGIMPQFFNEGGGVGVDPKSLQKLYDEQADDVARLEVFERGRGGISPADRPVYNALRTNVASRAADIAKLEAQQAAFEAGNTGATTPTSPEINSNVVSGGTGSDDATSSGKQAADSFANTFASSFKDALKTGDFSKILPALADEFTSSIIDQFVDGFTDSLFDKATGEGGFLSKIFNDQEGLGKDLAGLLQGTDGEGGIFEGIFASLKGFGETLSGFFGGLFNSITQLFAGGGGGGNFLGGLFSSLFGGFKFFSQGGVVPSTPYSQAGKDSVPTMLTPGEVVLSKNDVANQSSGNGQVVNNFSFQVTGDIDRQTQKNIVKMIPQITAGVNNHNRENNFKSR